MDLEGSAGVTAIQGKATATGGGDVLMDLGFRVRFGGAGWILFDTPTVPGGWDLHVAYGGVLAETDLIARPHGRVIARAFVGVGNAKVSVPVVTTLLGADNFGVFEPELQGIVLVHPRVGLTVGGSYRFAFGVQDLPGLSPEDLRGATVRVGIRFLGL